MRDILNCVIHDPRLIRDQFAIIWPARDTRVSATQKYAAIRGSNVFLCATCIFVSKTQEIVVEKVMEIVRMLAISIFFTPVFNKARMKVCNESKKQKLTLIGFSDV